jgi:hypothetical protein
MAKRKYPFQAPAGNVTQFRSGKTSYCTPALGFNEEKVWGVCYITAHLDKCLALHEVNIFAKIYFLYVMWYFSQ